jgi:hypothetical protein
VTRRERVDLVVGMPDLMSPDYMETDEVLGWCGA